MDASYRIVDFENYCPLCKFKDLEENKEPCEECLSTPMRQYSRKPEKFEEAEEKGKKKSKNDIPEKGK